MSTIEEVAQFESYGDDELFKRLGEVGLPGVMGASEGSDEDKIERGKRIFSARFPQIKKAVCVPSLLEKFSGDRYETVTLYATLIDCLAAIFTGVALAVAVVLVTRTGLKSFCKSEMEALARE